jgi:hypothetical protein
MAFSLLKAGASHVAAADVNPAQHAISRLKLTLHAQNWSLSDAASVTLAGALQEAAPEGWLRASDRELLSASKLASRPLLAAGDIDRRLRFLARWIAPWVMPSAADVRRFGRLRWRAPWHILGLGIRMVFPQSLRLYLPADLSSRLQRRMENSLAASDASGNAWLQRLLQPRPWIHEDALRTSWPDHAPTSGTAPLHLHEGSLDASPASQPFHMISASNIFDASPSDSLGQFLARLKSSTMIGSVVLVRSMFREAHEWGDMPAGWRIDPDATSESSKLDRAPLCRISVAVRRIS